MKRNTLKYVNPIKINWSVLALGCLTFLPAAWVNAQELSNPAGQVILSVSGNIGRTTDGESALFDRIELEKVGLTSIRSSTPWTDGIDEFEGVLLHDLLAYVGNHGGIVNVTALDGYVVTIPATDAEKYDVLLAMKQNGKYLRVRDRGPIWVIYPMPEGVDSLALQFRERSVWQLNLIVTE